MGFGLVAMAFGLAAVLFPAVGALVAVLGRQLSDVPGAESPSGRMDDV